MSEFQGGFRPKTLPSNPGHGPTIEIAFANDERSWTETADLSALLAEVLEERDHLVASYEGGWLAHPESGYVLLPQIASFQPLEPSGVRTTTTIQVHHPTLCPGGLFEYQHSSGSDTSDSIRKGFTQWSQVDFVTLLDAAMVDPRSRMRMEMQFPEKDGQPARTRRAILGPIANYQANPPAPTAEAGAGEDTEGENHSFCPCCLVTRSFEAFKELFEADEFYGLRLFALRDAEGEALADCRVNGEDFEPGANALRIANSITSRFRIA